MCINPRLTPWVKRNIEHVPNVIEREVLRPTLCSCRKRAQIDFSFEEISNCISDTFRTSRLHLQPGYSVFHHISANFCTGGCVMRMASLEDVFLKLTGRELRE